nr:TIM-barrel protein [Marseillevirus cajuinensis]
MSSSNSPSVLVCCSGYDFDHWKAPRGAIGFYDSKSSKKSRFDTYASEFPCLEINSTFYGTPTKKTFKEWKERAERTGHRYTAKVTKFITHSKKLNDFEETWGRFWDAISVLGDTLEALLFQFSPKFRNTEENRYKLAVVRKVLKSHKNLPSLCFEFRDPSWFDDPKIRKTFKRRNWCLVLPIAVNNEKKWVGTLPEYGIDDISTDSDTVYFRLHGTQGIYIGTYSDEFLTKLATKCKELSEQGKKVIVAFNNTDSYWCYKMTFRTLDEYLWAISDTTPSAVYNGRTLLGKLKQ